VPGKKRIQVMADSDSDGNEPQMPKKTKLELTVKEKEERYMAAAHISPQFDTMVGFFFDQDPRSGAADGGMAGKRASMRLCSRNMAIRFVPGVANSCRRSGAPLTGVNKVIDLVYNTSVLT